MSTVPLFVIEVASVWGSSKGSVLMGHVKSEVKLGLEVAADDGGESCSYL